MTAIARNIKEVKDPDIRARYNDIFENFLPNLVHQANILLHYYGHAFRDKDIDWGKVWETIERTYPALETALESAIQDLSAA
jgi:hypothetical protein